MEKPPWASGQVRIRRAALDAVEAFARAGYERDEEACGFLAGPADSPMLCDRAVELENLANKYHRVDPEHHPRTGREYFKINVLALERALREGREAGLPVKVFFHSHLDCGAYFSQEDAESMTFGGTEAPSYGLAYLVTAVDRGVVTAHKLFIWSESTRSFVEASFELEEP